MVDLKQRVGRLEARQEMGEERDHLFPSLLAVLPPQAVAGLYKR
jgi:hypothetical protein